MKITILSVGNIKEKYLKDAILEYSKRISKYSDIEFINVYDEPIKDNSSFKDNEIVKNSGTQFDKSVVKAFVDAYDKIDEIREKFADAQPQVPAPTET